MYLAVFELCSDIKVEEQFSYKLHWWEAHEMFHRFGCGLWWQMMICCIKDYSSCTCLSFLSSSWVFKEFAHSRCISIKQVKWYCSQALLFDALNLLALGLFRSTSSRLFTQVFCLGWAFVLLVLWNALELNSWWIECISACFAFLGGPQALWTTYFTLCLFDAEPWFLININVQVSCNHRH